MQQVGTILAFALIAGCASGPPTADAPSATERADIEAPSAPSPAAPTAKSPYRRALELEDRTWVVDCACDQLEAERCPEPYSPILLDCIDTAWATYGNDAYAELWEAEIAAHERYLTCRAAACDDSCLDTLESELEPLHLTEAAAPAFDQVGDATEACFAPGAIL